MDRVDIALKAAWHRWGQLHLGALGAPQPEAAEALESKLKTAHQRRRAGTLDGQAFVAWVTTFCPWLPRALGDVPPPPRRVWAPPPPPVPAPTPAHAAVAARIGGSG
jgi:hypothetical protein